MKLRKIRVERFPHSDDLGSIVLPYADVLIDPSENDVDSKSFHQKKHQYSLSSTEIERISRASAQKFHDESYKKVLASEKVLTAGEINGIKDFLKVSGTDLGVLIGLDKSSVSRLLSNKQSLLKDKMILLLDRVREELEHPSRARITLDSVHKAERPKCVERLRIPAIKVAEFFIRKFINTDSPITHLKLQKLLYYAQGIAFGRSDIKLMEEGIEAWEHGPVIRDVYRVFNGSDNRPLPVNSSLTLDEIEKNGCVLDILEETISLYGVYDAWFLREKTHNEKPWAATNRNEVISDELMISFFKGILV